MLLLLLRILAPLPSHPWTNTLKLSSRVAPTNGYSTTETELGAVFFALSMGFASTSCSLLFPLRTCSFSRAGASQHFFLRAKSKYLMFGGHRDWVPIIRFSHCRRKHPSTVVNKWGRLCVNKVLFIKQDGCWI